MEDADRPVDRADIAIALAQRDHRGARNAVEEDLDAAPEIDLVIDLLRGLRGRNAVEIVELADARIDALRRRDLGWNIRRHLEALPLRLRAPQRHGGDEDRGGKGENGFH